MKHTFIVLFLLTSFSGFTQITGNWQGFLMKNGETVDQAHIIYFEFKSDGKFVAKTREEIINKEGYSIKSLTGEITGNKATLKQTQSVEKKDISGNRWCNLDFTLEYTDSTGYLTGTFISTECRGNIGKIICYRSASPIENGATKTAYQAWSKFFKDDVKHNRKAPEIRALERKNFVFQAIYFDFDKTEIKPEYFDYLNRLVHVVDGHSDLRIKVIGNTDSDGSNIYNIDLSERRAKALIDYFVAAGLAPDRIVIDFKGETNPKGDNSTSAGRQENRRVDFTFI
jgi:outer membrane protein OmpA-like peptidoglycan-associated protein